MAHHGQAVHHHPITHQQHTPLIALAIEETIAALKRKEEAQRKRRETLARKKRDTKEADR